jgi:hypothetical protein
MSIAKYQQMNEPNAQVFLTARRLRRFAGVFVWRLAGGPGSASQPPHKNSCGPLHGPKSTHIVSTTLL